MKSYDNIIDLKNDLNNKTQFLILVYIILFSPVRLKDLAEFLKSNFGLTKGAIYQNLNFLVDNEFIRRLSDIEALKYRSENRRIIPSIFENTTEINNMEPFDKNNMKSEENVKKIMELALISLNKEDALTMCWNSLWFMTAMKEKIDNEKDVDYVIDFFRDLRKKIIEDGIYFE